MSRDLFLVFNSHFDRDRGLDQGRLSVNSLQYGTQNIWLAASSYSTLQGFESFHKRGGYLPPQYRVPNLRYWTVNLQPIDLWHNKGVQGNFYVLTPHQVTTDRGSARSDFGIHKDANAPGSLGCIVLTEDRFADFEDKMLSLKTQGITELPLFVFYS